jgi:hypothetical protein
MTIIDVYEELEKEHANILHRYFAIRQSGQVENSMKAKGKEMTEAYSRVIDSIGDKIILFQNGDKIRALVVWDYEGYQTLEERDVVDFV